MQVLHGGLVCGKDPVPNRVPVQEYMVLALVHSRLDTVSVRVGRQLVGSSDHRMTLHEWDTAALEVEHAIQLTLHEWDTAALEVEHAIQWAFHECYIAALKVEHVIQQTARG